MSRLSWWIKERDNPQFDKPYYIMCGQITKAEAKRKENTMYGSVIMLEYKTEEEYNNAIIKLKVEGYSVR